MGGTTKHFKKTPFLAVDFYQNSQHKINKSSFFLICENYILI